MKIRIKQTTVTITSVSPNGSMTFRTRDEGIVAKDITVLNEEAIMGLYLSGVLEIGSVCRIVTPENSNLPGIAGTVEAPSFK